ncbi:MAG TPA: MBL fold metallo-hydrolase [Actinomycetota bacterium]|nr:MBL fold metallo-hydrolase [Actinomycetota bacterium]
MLFRQVLHEDRSCASYLVGCPTMGVTAIVDPQGDTARYSSLAATHALRITDVIDTHVHADHPSTARELAAETGATLRMSAEAAVGFDYQPLSDGDVVTVGNRRMKVIATPGHTPDHVCLAVDDWFVLTGDTLFVGDVGRVDLAVDDLDTEHLEARARTLHSSLQRLLELRDDVEVYPGHYSGSTCGRGMDGKPSSTIGRERRTNKALRLTEDEFVAFQVEDMPPLPEDFHAIKRANMGLVAS